MLGQQLPRKRILAARGQPLADRRDRPLARVVDERQGTAGRLVAKGSVDDDAESLEPFARPAAEGVVAERGVERRPSCQAGQRDGGDGAAAGRLIPRLARVDDLAGARDMRHANELDPLDVSDYGGVHAGRPRAARRAT